jgi:hypothetical protein
VPPIRSLLVFRVMARIRFRLAASRVVATPRGWACRVMARIRYRSAASRVAVLLARRAAFPATGPILAAWVVFPATAPIRFRWAAFPVAPAASALRPGPAAAAPAARA